MKKPMKFNFRGPDGRIVSKEGATLVDAINKLGDGVTFDGDGLDTFDVVRHKKTVKYTYVGDHEAA